MAKKKNPYVAKGKLRSSSAKHYFNVLLWGTQDDYERAAEAERGQTVAMCITDTMTDTETGAITVNPKLGEIHFVSGTWCVNTVAHECQHAIIHRMRYLQPGPAKVLNEFAPDHDTNDEEIIAYEAGSWVEACMAWLTNNDPASRYPKKMFDR